MKGFADFKQQAGFLAKYFKFIFLTLLIGYLFWSDRFDFNKINAFWGIKNLYVLIIVLVAIFLNQFVLALRQVVLIKHLCGNISVIISFRITLVSLFYSNFLPGGGAADLVRLYYLKKHTCMSYPELTSIVLVDRCIGLLGLTILTFISLSFFIIIEPDLFLFIKGFGQKVYLGGLILLLPMILLGSVFFLRIEWLYGIIYKKFNEGILGNMVMSFLDGLKKFASRRRILIYGLLLSIIGQYFMILGISYVAGHLYDQHAFWASMLGSPLVIISSFIPVTPGNIGWTEMSAETIWKIVGVQGGATVFALTRIITGIFSLSGGVLYLFEKKRHHVEINEISKQQLKLKESA